MSWDTFRTTFIDQGLAVSVPIAGEPPITIFSDPKHKRIGLRLPAPNDPVPPTHMRAVTLERSGPWLILATDNPELHQPFYALIQDISDRVQLDHRAFASAFEEALGRWRMMLLRGTLLTDEVQLGLTGELWLLLRLLRALGANAIGTWTATGPDAHDFRLGDHEIEVKTTSGETRTHMINRLDQLQPSPGSTLHLLSLQIVPAGLGAGWTLSEQIEEIRRLLASRPQARRTFDSALEGLGWADADSGYYPRRYKLRNLAVLVTVDERCPRIVPEDIFSILGPLANRVSDVRYRIDVDGLGVEDGTADFDLVIPKA